MQAFWTVGSEFVNRKNFASFSVQATCDDQYKFTSLDVGWPGSVHDSHIFKTSELYHFLNENHNCGIILGDLGYVITPFLMTPLSNATTELQLFSTNIMRKIGS